MEEQSPVDVKMAPSDSFLERVKDDGYRQWLLAGQGLLCCKYGLEEISTEIMEELHKILLKDPRLKNPKCKPNCGSQKKIGEFTKCNVCKMWIKCITEQMRENTYACWKNCDIQECHKVPWEIAKAFMTNGATGSSAMETDSAGLLKFLANAKRFEEPELANEVLKGRNKIMHAANLRLEKKERDQILDDIEALLKHVEAKTKSQTTSAALNELGEIKEMDSSSFEILSEQTKKIMENENKIWNEVITRMEHINADLEERQKEQKETLEEQKQTQEEQKKQIEEIAASKKTLLGIKNFISSYSDLREKFVVSQASQEAKRIG